MLFILISTLTFFARFVLIPLSLALAAFFIKYYYDKRAEYFNRKLLKKYLENWVDSMVSVIKRETDELKIFGDKMTDINNTDYNFNTHNILNTRLNEIDNFKLLDMIENLNIKDKFGLKYLYYNISTEILNINNTNQNYKDHYEKDNQVFVEIVEEYNSTQEEFLKFLGRSFLTNNPHKSTPFHIDVNTVRMQWIRYPEELKTKQSIRIELYNKLDDVFKKYFSDPLFTDLIVDLVNKLSPILNSYEKQEKLGDFLKDKYYRFAERLDDSFQSLHFHVNILKQIELKNKNWFEWKKIEWIKLISNNWTMFWVEIVLFIVLSFFLLMKAISCSLGM